MKNAVFWDITPCGSCKNRCFGGTYRLYLQVVFICSGLRLLVTANVVPTSSILVTLIEVLRSSETSVLRTATRRKIPEDGIKCLGSLGLQAVGLERCPLGLVRSTEELLE
jgi:hypothetical protein